MEIDDPDSGSHQPSETVRDLSESSSNNVLQDTNLHHSEHENIRHQQFEIEGDAFVQDEDIFLSSSRVDEPKNIKEVLSNDNWKIDYKKK